MATPNTKSRDSKQQFGAILVANLTVAIVAAFFGSLHESFVMDKSSAQRTFNLLTVCIGTGLLIVLAAVTYIFGSLAIDTGRLLLYAATLLALFLTLRSLVLTLKFWKRLT